MKSKILTLEQKSQIAQAIKEAEMMTSGEIVPMIVRRSDEYSDLRWMFAAVFALAAAFALVMTSLIVDPLLILWAELPALAVGFALARLPWIERLLLPKALAVAKVHQRAAQAFQTLGIRATQEHTGILILVSLAERRVEVLADSAIHAKAPAGTWDALVKTLLERIRRDELSEGLCQAVIECGRVLAKDFPRRADDVNELEDAVRIEN